MHLYCYTSYTYSMSMIRPPRRSTLFPYTTLFRSMQISISSLQTHNVNRCGRSRHLARKLSLRRKRSSQMTTSTTSRSEERFSRNAETDLVCRLLLEKKNNNSRQTVKQHETALGEW